MFNVEFHYDLLRVVICEYGTLPRKLCCYYQHHQRKFIFRLTSPSGTQSVLLFERPRDVLDSSFDDWPFMSVHFWGERAAGRWKLEVLNAGAKRVNKPGTCSRRESVLLITVFQMQIFCNSTGILKKWQLVFYGTDTNPIRLRSLQTPRPTFPNLGVSGGIATMGRDVHGMTAPQSVVTPFAPTFTSLGRVPNPGNQVLFPGNPGFRPSFFPNTGYPDFLQVILVLTVLLVFVL